MFAKSAKTWNNIKIMSVLRIVATPIGNLEDLGLRALRVLKESQYILCEDTRVTKKLLDRYEIKTPMLSFHQHSGELKMEKVLELLKAGNDLALVTDAGTPGISDPGGKLVDAVRNEMKEQVLIESVPGPSALAAAISVVGSGFDKFLFLGFLPNKKGRQKKIKEIFSTEYPVVLYESKHRILKLLEELKKEELTSDKELQIFLARELSKLHESFYIGDADRLLGILKNDTNALKGEFVVMIKKIDK